MNGTRRPRGAWRAATVIAVLLAGTGAAGAQDGDPGTLLERAASAYAGIEGFCAEFEQERIVPLLNQTTRSRGTLCQLDPGYFLMDFSDPEGDRVVADGEHLWLYFPSTDPGQAVRTRLGEGGRAFDFHREFLRDPAERFEADYVGPDTVTGRPTEVVELQPHDDPSYVRATVWLEVDRGLIRKVEIEEENRSLRRVVLSDIRTDPGLDPSRFAFTPPPGVDVIRRDAGPTPGR